LHQLGNKGYMFCTVHSSKGHWWTCLCGPNIRGTLTSTNPSCLPVSACPSQLSDIRDYKIECSWCLEILADWLWGKLCFRIEFKGPKGTGSWFFRDW